MVDGDCLVAEGLAKVGLLLGEACFPLGGMVDGDWGHVGMICVGGCWGGIEDKTPLRHAARATSPRGRREGQEGLYHCPLPIAHCPLPIAHCPLPSSQNGSHPRSRMTLRVAFDPMTIQY